MAGNYQPCAALMKKMICIATVAIFSVFSFIANPLVALNSNILDDGFAPQASTEFGYHGVIFREQAQFEETFSWLKSAAGLTCENYRGNCQQLTGPFSFHALLPPCASPTQLDCIESLEMITNDQNKVTGNYVAPFTTFGRNDFPADAEASLPNGGTSGVWRFPGLTHAGGQDFFLRVGVSGSEVNGRFGIKSFHAELNGVENIPAPCKEFGNNYCGPRLNTFLEREDGTKLGGVAISTWSGLWSNGPSDCIMTGDSQCLQRRAFSGDPKFQIAVRLHESPSGWLHGRITESEIKIDPLSSSDQSVRIMISGKLVRVPVISTGDLYSNLPSSVQSAYKGGGFKRSPWLTRDFGCTRCADPLTRNLTSYPYPYGQDGMDELLLWLPAVKDTATANLSTWSIRTLTANELSGATSCLKDTKRLVGLVTTNATQYGAGPPSFVNNSLDYQVAAPHYTSNGDEFLGTYDLIMRSDVARCLYGFSNAPLNASISVVDNSGVSTAATKLVSEKDGWLRIAAYGFGFSTPTIKVNLSQESSPAIKKVLAKKVTITCKKGKVVKKITGLKPSCPRNFRKIA